MKKFYKKNKRLTSLYSDFSEVGKKIEVCLKVDILIFKIPLRNTL